jgi:hypothetical protein
MVDNRESGKMHSNLKKPLKIQNTKAHVRTDNANRAQHNNARERESTQYNGGTREQTTTIRNLQKIITCEIV